VSVPLTDDPNAGRRKLPVASACADDRLASAKLRERALARYSTLFPAADEQTISQALATLYVCLDQDEYLAALHLGHRALLCYAEDGQRFEISKLRAGRRSVEVAGNARADLETPLRDDEFLVRLLDESVGNLRRGQVTAHNRARVELATSALAEATLYDQAEATLANGSGGTVFAHDSSRVVLFRGLYVFACSHARVAVDLEQAVGTVVLCEGASLFDLGGRLICDAADLKRVGNELGNERWLRGDSLTAYHWDWIRR
jgi:hypothetical protein